MRPLDAAWLRAHPLPRPDDGGKESRGSVLVVGGGLELVGAVLLAGGGALRAGAGKLQMAAAPAAVAALATAMPEARVFELPEGQAALTDLLTQSAQRCDALLVGPGMMQDDAGLARALIAAAGEQPLVLDAGALVALTAGATRGPGPLVLTPHAGEMARLLKREKAQVEADPLAAARDAARAFDAIIAMKGATTHVVSPDGSAILYGGGGVGLGTSGSGDVLAGLIAGLLARGVDAFSATAWAVYLHGEAGARLAARIGSLGFLAREIAPEVPAIMGAFG